MGDELVVPTGYRKTERRSARTDTTSTYTALLAQVRSAGLLGRRTGWYWGLIAGLAVLLVLTGGAFAVLGGSWYQLIVAGVLGALFTQFAFLSHEAAHRQVFASHHWNDRAARYAGTFLTGINYAWWMNKHTRHHANPNTVGKDPDISFDAISFRPEDAASRTGFLRVLVRVQGYAFFPMLLVEGVNLHWQSIRTYTSRGPVKRRWAEDRSSSAGSCSTSVSCSGSCRSAWPSRSSVCSSPCSGSSWGSRSRRTTRACPSSNPVAAWTSSRARS